VVDISVATFVENVSFLFFIYLWGWSGNGSTITAAIYGPIAPALDDRW
jgi:hypothetical protein